jgi:hypothetical protein
MKSLTTTPKGTKKSSEIFDDIILLPFSDVEEDTDQLLKEMMEEEELAKLNGAQSLMAEIINVNAIRFSTLSRVA